MCVSVRSNPGPYCRCVLLGMLGTVFSPRLLLLLRLLLPSFRPILAPELTPQQQEQQRALPRWNTGERKALRTLTLFLSHTHARTHIYVCVCIYINIYTRGGRKHPACRSPHCRRVLNNTSQKAPKSCLFLTPAGTGLLLPLLPCSPFEKKNLGAHHGLRVSNSIRRLF